MSSSLESLTLILKCNIHIRTCLRVWVLLINTIEPEIEVQTLLNTTEVLPTFMMLKTEQKSPEVLKFQTGSAPTLSTPAIPQSWRYTVPKQKCKQNHQGGLFVGWLSIFLLLVCFLSQWSRISTREGHVRCQCDKICLQETEFNTMFGICTWRHNDHMLTTTTSVSKTIGDSLSSAKHDFLTLISDCRVWLHCCGSNT